jgi:hypothetical protein
LFKSVFFIILLPSSDFSSNSSEVFGKQDLFFLESLSHISSSVSFQRHNIPTSSTSLLKSFDTSMNVCAILIEKEWRKAKNKRMTTIIEDVMLVPVKEPLGMRPPLGCRE